MYVFIYYLFNVFRDSAILILHFANLNKPNNIHLFSQNNLQSWQIPFALIWAHIFHEDVDSDLTVIVYCVFQKYSYWSKHRISFLFLVEETLMFSFHLVCYHASVLFICQLFSVQTKINIPRIFVHLPHITMNVQFVCCPEFCQVLCYFYWMFPLPSLCLWLCVMSQVLNFLPLSLSMVGLLMGFCKWLPSKLAVPYFLVTSCCLSVVHLLLFCNFLKSLTLSVLN